MLPELADLRDRITTLRTRAGLTQQEAAERADVSQSFVAKLENGDNVPNYAAVVRLYNTLERMNSTGSETAADIKTAPINSVAPTDTVEHASQVMKDHGYSQLPVLSNGDCVGAVTSRTLLDADPDALVEDHMAEPFPAVPGDTDTDAVAALLESANAVLVREDEAIAGIVTASDVL